MTFRFYWILVLFLSVVATLMLFLVWLIFPSLSA
nr:MAG TPA: ST7 of tumorigenicity 7 [Caudoviricetes sp.]